MHAVVEQEERGAADDVPFPAPVAAGPRTQVERRARWAGIGLVALAGASYAVQSILAKEAYAAGADVRTVLAVRFVVATLTGWASCLTIGALAGLAVTSVLTGIGRIGSSRTAIVSTCEPAAAIILGAVVLGEAFTPVTLLGGLCIVVAIVALSVVHEVAT